MSDDVKKPSIFDELNKQIKAANGELPDTFTAGGETYVRRGSAAKPVVKRGKWAKGRDVREGEVELVSVTINVAPHSDRIVYNSTIYLANRTYDVPVDLAATLKDIISQTWKHEHQTGGANSYLATGGVRNPNALSPGVGFGS